jgi:UDP-N-acetyl-2-amino-2-deoxyglucuronate dehydrogenase
MMLRAAVIGVKGIGRTHLAAYRALGQEASPICRLQAVCDVDDAALERARAEFGASRAITDYRALLDDPEVDVVSLCVPHFLHRRMALDTIAAGKHLLLEKPVGMTYGEAMEIAAAARGGRGTTGVIFQSRFDPRLQFVRAEVLPRLGKVRFASSREYHWRGSQYYAGGAWRGTWWGEGGGLFINQCIHGWDVLQWLLGGVDYAYGYWANLMHPTIEVEDIGYAFVQFRGPNGEGVPAKTVATACQEMPRVTESTAWERRLAIQIVGEHGEVVANDFRAPRMKLPMADFRLQDEELDRELHARMEEGAQAAVSTGRAGDHPSNIRSFLEAIRDGRSAPVTPESAAEVQKIIDGVHWHGWSHAAAFRDWAAATGPIPVDADQARAIGWDGGEMWRALLDIVEDPAPGLGAPFLP